MRIKLHGIIKDYTNEEYEGLTEQGYKFRPNRKEGILEPASITISEDGILRDMGMDELVNCKRAGQKFVSIKENHRTVMVPVTDEVYKEYMRPEWREDKREERLCECIYKKKKACTRQNCESCTTPIYRTESLEHATEVHGFQPGSSKEEVEKAVARNELKRLLRDIIAELDLEDQQIWDGLLDEKSERELAEELGYSSKTSIHKRKEKLFSVLRKKLSDFR